MESLNCVLKGGAIDFHKNVGADLDDVVRSDRQEEPIKGRVVQPTQSNSVRDNRFALRLRIRHDVGRVQQLNVPQTAKSALILVRAENALAECPLMQSTSGQRRDVFSSEFRDPSHGFLWQRKRTRVDGIVDRD